MSHTTRRRGRPRVIAVVGAALVGAAIVGSLGGAGVVGTAAVESTPVSATYTPSEIALLPGESRAAVLSVENPTAASVTVTPSVVLPDDATTPVKVTFKVHGPKVVPAGGSATFDATVLLRAQLASDFTIVTSIAYAGTGPAGAALATLKVTSATAPTAAPSALGIRATGDTTLIDTQNADLYFTIQNSTGMTQAISRGTLTFPGFLHVEQVNTARTSADGAGTLTVDVPTSLGPGNGAIVHVRVSAPHGVQPGNALIVLAVEYTEPVSKAAGFATANQALTLSVFGEQAVTGAFGAVLAPALFVVPGILFVLVAWFFWWRVYPRTFPIDVTPPSVLTGTAILAILGVLFALPFPFLYRLISNRDYSVQYGFTDIGWMCLLGIGTGLIVWGLAIGARGTIRCWRFELGDRAAKTFRKLTRFRRDLTAVDNAMYNGGPVFVLRTEATTALVCPLIEVAAPPDDTVFATDLDRRITARQNHELYRLVKKRGMLGLTQYAPTTVNTVERVKLTDLGAFGRGRIVQISDEQ